MKALGILTNDNIFDERYISENEYYKKEIEEAIKELRELIAKDKSKNCEECYDKTKLAIENINKDIESIQKENTRLKKQLSKGHHIECSCSFCKPIDEKVLKEFTFTSCEDCKNKIDGTYQEICSNCKRFYGCYFEAKEV